MRVIMANATWSWPSSSPARARWGAGGGLHVKTSKVHQVQKRPSPKSKGCLSLQDGHLPLRTFLNFCAIFAQKYAATLLAVRRQPR
jgi:hypothetical protein